MATKAHLEGNKRYHEKLDEIKLRVPKGKKEIIQEFAKSKGKSLNSFVNEAIDKEMSCDNTTQTITISTEPEQELVSDNKNTNDNQSYNEPILVPSDNNSDMLQSLGITKEDMQKADEDAKRWKASQERKEQEKKDKKKMRMIAINQLDDITQHSNDNQKDGE